MGRGDKIYYCRCCKDTFQEPTYYSENRCPRGERSDSSWIEHYYGCPSCGGGYIEMYLCEECGEYKEKVEYYPFANQYMCEECYDKMMEDSELAKEGLEETIKNDELRGLPISERDEA